MDSSSDQLDSRNDALETAQAVVFVAGALYYSKCIRQQVLLTCSRIAAASMATLVAYDICIFFADEINLVWKKRWSLGTLLYLPMRYGSLGLSIGALYGSLYTNPSASRCHMLTRAYTACACSLRLVINVSQLQRLAALYGASKYKRLLVYIGGSVQVAVLFGISVKLVLSYEPIRYPFSGVSCALLSAFRTPIYLSFNALVLLADLVICLACAHNVYQVWINGKSRLARIMFRDTLVYMFMLTGLVIPQLFTPLFLQVSSAVVVAGLNFVIYAISAIVACRMALNIRSVCLGQQMISLDAMTATWPESTTRSQIAFVHGDEETGDDAVQTTG